MAPSKTLPERWQQILCILGMAMVWPSVHNQVLYPLTFSFHKEGALSPFAYYLLYSLVMLLTVGCILLMGRKGLTQRLFAHAPAIVTVGLLGAIGLGLLVVCDFEHGAAPWLMGVGVALSAVFVPVYFMFWSVRLVYASQKRAAFDLVLSYVVFAIITLVRLFFDIHAWMFSIAYPVISAALAAAVLRAPQKSKFALGNTPLSGLPVHLLVPCVFFVYLATVTRCLLNPIDAAFDYPPYHRLLIYVILIALTVLLAFLYRPRGKSRRNANLLSFSLITVFLVGSILLTGIGLVDNAALGNLPTITGINAVELFIWMLVLANAQIKHAGIVRPAALFLVLVVGASHLLTVLWLGGVQMFQIDVTQLPLIVITIVLAFLVVIVVMTVMAIMLNRLHSTSPSFAMGAAGNRRYASDAASAAAASVPGSGDGTAETVNAVGSATVPTLGAATPSGNPAVRQGGTLYEAAASASGSNQAADLSARAQAGNLSLSAAGAPLASGAIPPCMTMAADEAAIVRIQESFGLSKRETDTLRLAARNKSAKEIAESLFVAESTVNSHIKGIYRKCDVHSRQELIALVKRFKREQTR